MINTFKRISRKTFFKQLAVFLSVPYAYIAFKTILRQKETSGIQEIRFPSELGKDIVFQQDVIIVNRNKQLHFFSSKCTHLGCRISNLKNDQLVCACHGSHFSLDGKVINGPASTNLKELSFTFDTENQEYIVKIG